MELVLRFIETDPIVKEWITIKSWLEQIFDEESSFAPYNIVKRRFESLTEDELFCQKIYRMIRSGKSDEAIQYCIDNEQNWRASLLAGGSYSTDSVSLLTTNQENGRRLWKRTLNEIIATSGKCGIWERAVLGSLCGNLLALKSVVGWFKGCFDFHDYLWSHLVCLIEDRIEKVLIFLN